MHGQHEDDHGEATPLQRPVPRGFVAAFSDALSRNMPKGAVGSIAMWEGKERVGINFRDVFDQDRVITAVSDALQAIDSRFDYFPGIDISIWKK